MGRVIIWFTLGPYSSLGRMWVIKTHGVVGPNSEKLKFDPKDLGGELERLPTGDANFS